MGELTGQAYGGGGHGGGSSSDAGVSGRDATTYGSRTGGAGGAGGTAGNAGGAGTLYKAPTASVNVSRTTQSATTHPAAQYTITFNADGGTLPSGGQTAAATLGCALSAITVPTRTGYTFGGYYTAKNGGGTQYYTAAGASARSWDKTEATTLYAKWTANTYSVKFNANTGSGSMSNESFTYGTAKALTANAFTQTGYTFIGWATSASGAVVYNDKQSVSNLTATANGTVNLYAKWTANAYSVKFNKNATDATGTMSNESFAYGRAKALTANAFTRAGYTFAGWATSDSGAVVYSDMQSILNLTAVNGGMVNLYAKWELTQYQISVTATGAGSCSFGTQWVDVGTTATATVVPTSSSYRIKLLGDINGVTLDGTTVSIPATQKRNITVSVTDNAEPCTYYADAANGSNANNGLSWGTAKKSIQHAIDLAYEGDTILVADGTYSRITARCLGIEIRSVNGAASTIIDAGGENRCALLGYTTNDVVTTKLVGFTLRNGCNVLGAGAQGGVVEDCVIAGNYAGSESDVSLLKDGGGLYNSIATGCVITNNAATRFGGGAYGCDLTRCVLSGNVSEDDGGGAHSCTLTDCLVADNEARNTGGTFSGGGIIRCTAARCTISGNRAGYGSSSRPGGAGADTSVLSSCIVYGNAYSDGTANDVDNCTATYSCFGSDVSGTGNIAADPLFADAANGDYRLSAGSPCIDKGVTSGLTWQSVDLDGRCRRVGPYVDMGCYEFSTHRDPTTIHVDVATGNDANDGLSPSAPKKSIQSALEWSIDGDTILVNDGVYTRNKNIVVNNEAFNRIVTIRSVNGPERTIIDGGGAMRCVKLSVALDGRTSQQVATLSGFTITNGVSHTIGGVSHGVVENCIIAGCVGTSGSTSGGDYVGGAIQCKLVNCLIRGNSVIAGSGNPKAGGAARCDLYNCTVVGNAAVAGTPAGGISSCKAYNCIVVGNTVGGEPSDAGTGCTVANSCLGASFSGTSNIVEDPLFADAASGDYRLLAGSPCIGAGDNAKVVGETDLAGGTRVRGLGVDMGCYEWQGPPVTPVITPAGGTILTGSVSVVISCATEGATIHFTTNGATPTADSPVYRRFRASERTIVKAVAIRDGLCSEVAVAEYALGQCADPVITPADGTTFEHSGQSVSIAWSGDDGTLRYTTDGSDPMAGSPVYAGPFTIDETTVVKAKAFGDQYFDSAVVTAALTRVSAHVATPVITAAATFSGSKTTVELACATEGATIRYTTNGSNPNSHSRRYTGPFDVTESCTVKAYATCADFLDSEVASFSIEKIWGIGDTMGAPDQAFTTGGDLPFVRVTDATAPLGESMKSGAITHNQTSTLSTTITGPGTVSFQWRTSCEQDDGGLFEWDHAEFELDGVAVAKLDGVTAWQTVTQEVTGNGEHTLVWRYVKDDVSSEGEDACWVADFCWDPAFTESVETPVITAAATFTGSKTLVTLSCATAGAIIRYTLDGSAPDAESPVYAGSFDVTESCTVKAYAVRTGYLDSAVAVFAIEKIWCIGDTMGAPDQAFTTGGDLPFFRVNDATAPLGESMKSGAITHNQTSTLTTTVTGLGTVSFQWRTSCEKDDENLFEWDHAEFEVDGDVVAKLDGVTTWQTVIWSMTGDGNHTLVWRYVKDDIESEGEDACWVADFGWISRTATETTEVPVPYTWLHGHYPVMAHDTDAYETAAHATAANGIHTVWECYVAGLDPTDPAARFLAEMSFDESGRPSVSWKPDLGNDRNYVVEGKASLADEWGSVNEESRFFRVKVSLPQAP